MPRRRRNRNQKRRVAVPFASTPIAGAESRSRDRGDSVGRPDDKDRRGAAAEAPPTETEGVRSEAFEPTVTIDNLQTRPDRQGPAEQPDANLGTADNFNRPDKDLKLPDKEISEINRKICIPPINVGAINTPPLSARFDGPITSCTDILNNLTPKRNVKNVRNESYIDNLCTTNSSTALLKTCRANKFHRRSNSSMSKLRSPGVEKIPLTVDASTQTDERSDNFNRNNINNVNNKNRKVTVEESLHLKSCVNIFETPKMSKVDLTKGQRRIDADKLEFTPLDLNKVRYKKLKNFSEILYADSDLKHLSDAEASFQNLIDIKDVSTPINRINRMNLDKIVTKHSIHNNNRWLNVKINNNDRLKAMDRNPSFKLKSNEKIKVKKFETSLITKKRYKNISPRKIRELTLKNVPPTSDYKKRNEKESVPKSFTPLRSSYSKPTDNILNVSTAEHPKSVLRPKRYHTRFVGRWIAKISELCTWLGLNLKKSLSTSVPYRCHAIKSINQPINCINRPINCVNRPINCVNRPINSVNRPINSVNQPINFNNGPINFDDQCTYSNNQAFTFCGHCEEYRLKLIVLSSKIEVLERELGKSTVENRETIAGLVGEIKKMKDELSGIEEIKKQLKELEEAVKSKPRPVGGVVPPPPPLPFAAAPAAPPLPPPLPPPMVNLHQDGNTGRPKSGGGQIKKAERKGNDNSRPVISLDDILKVKLKKTTDKPLSARRAQQPLISVEMLSQVKLRPTSRPETPCRFNDATSTHNASGGACAGLSNSPAGAASLSKILSNVDTNVRRVKRLRRTNRYSLDDFSRRRTLRREWSGTDDT